MKNISVAAFVIWTSLATVVAHADKSDPHHAAKSCPDGYTVNGDMCIPITTVCEGTGPAAVVEAVCAAIINAARAAASKVNDLGQ